MLLVRQLLQIWPIILLQSLTIATGFLFDLKRGYMTESSSIFDSESHRNYILKNYVDNAIAPTSTESRYDFNKNIRKSAFKVDDVNVVEIKVRGLNNAEQTLEAACTAEICFLKKQDLCNVCTVKSCRVLNEFFQIGRIDECWFTN